MHGGPHLESPANHEVIDNCYWSQCSQVGVVFMIQESTFIETTLRYVFHVHHAKVKADILEWGFQNLVLQDDVGESTNKVISNLVALVA